MKGGIPGQISCLFETSQQTRYGNPRYLPIKLTSSKVVLITSAVTFLSLVLATLDKGAVCNQSGGGHKSQDEITRMTADQRVQEYSKEYIRHNVWHTDYLGLLTNYIARDGLNSIPAIVKLLDRFDPTDRTRKENDRYEASSAAVLLLADLDLSAFRLRGFEVGRAGIASLKRLTDRMRSANFEADPSEDERSKKSAR